MPVAPVGPVQSKIRHLFRTSHGKGCHIKAKANTMVQLYAALIATLHSEQEMHSRT